MTDEISGGAVRPDSPARREENNPLTEAKTVSASDTSAASPAGTPAEPVNHAPVKEKFNADSIDIGFSLFLFVVGYLFVRWLFFSWRGWAVALFTIIYCGTVIFYLLKKGVKISSEGWFCIAITAITGFSYAFWSGHGLEPFRGIFLFCAAVYSVISASGVQILGKTGNLLFLDGINAVFVIPARNITAQYRCIAALRKSKPSGKKALPIVIGTLLALFVITILTPLLLEADSGGFSRLISGIAESLMRVFHRLRIAHVIIALPVSAYIFALIFGCANRHGCGSFNAENATGDIRILPASTVHTLLGIVCAFYLLFIGTQLPYFFSAFSGNRPAGWEIYSEYARRGFFELCVIALINLSLITLANVLSKAPRVKSRALRVFNTLFIIITMLLIATAFSKMALYVAVYGMSMRRLLPCVFMFFLFIVCCGVIILQKRSFSIVRFAAVTGAVMFCLLCISDPDGFTARYNANRYLDGSLSSFDVDILYRAGPAGVDAATRVYERTSDKDLRYALRRYIISERSAAEGSKGKSSDNLQKMITRNVSLAE